ncbi:TfoX/Sxy family protein [Aquicoccus sp. G2-2]|uniref:TfoX/Sxy family protein n=1 Tax=Aquicoccus sp. G2-2 TaxID=3092120 RepID=UPI002AE0409D|nr:TfoX/Sxy family protein [Aquicoccus sp. G2-2]MEA1113181.1 TfoX/Sxy family protein [Aquicoccus sp. G2-2]
MAYDEGTAALLRDELAEYVLGERKMFGALCFMLRGHMLCCAQASGALFRVGAANLDAACALPGVAQMQMKARRMAGFVTASDAAFADDDIRGHLLELALAFNATLEPK